MTFFMGVGGTTGRTAGWARAALLACACMLLGGCSVKTAPRDDGMRNGDGTGGQSGDGDAPAGDGDGDTTAGDGDGDGSGGSAPGDGDGDAGPGDGDGDSVSGDGDGDGDGDGIPPGVGEPYAKCASDGDCGDGLQCVTTFCAPSCSDLNDCPSPGGTPQLGCISGRCTLSCSPIQVCPPGMACMFPFDTACSYQ